MSISVPCSARWRSARDVIEAPQNRKRFVVIISADATPAQVERLLAAGAHDYLTKPLQVRGLLVLLDAALAREASPR